MSKPRGVGPAPTREINEGFVELIATIARGLMWIGVLLSVVGLGFLLYTCFAFSKGVTPSPPAQALVNIGILRNILLAGVLALGVGSSYLYWGESVLGGLQLLGAVLMFFSPFILGQAGIAAGPGGDKDPVTAAMTALTQGGLVLGMIGLFVLALDLAGRAKERTQVGWKSDQTRYGKGVKEEQDRHNVFMGKCWQLPFCRKFVRERCPIYHARRTCWKELTGCMCEEEVIRNAMENKAIPKDALMAATYIPRNLKLTFDQKRERCKSCVIYNEHQKHKYKIALPGTIGLFAVVYIGLHGPLIQLMSGLIGGLDRMIGNFTYSNKDHLAQPTMFQELLLACLMIVCLAYAMKILEHVIFKLKV